MSGRGPARWQTPTRKGGYYPLPRSPPSSVYLRQQKTYPRNYSAPKVFFRKPPPRGVLAPPQQQPTAAAAQRAALHDRQRQRPGGLARQASPPAATRAYTPSLAVQSGSGRAAPRTPPAPPAFLRQPPPSPPTGAAQPLGAVPRAAPRQQTPPFSGAPLAVRGLSTWELAARTGTRSRSPRRSGSRSHVKSPPRALALADGGAAQGAAAASRRPRGGPDAPVTRVRELHCFPLRHARVYFPRGVMGYEEEHGDCGPGSWEDVAGVLCGPAAFEVLRRHRCPLFASVAGPSYHPYRLYHMVPRYKRLDSPKDAVLLVLDFRTRRDFIAFLVAVQGVLGTGEVLSYGRVLWMLAVQRIQRARAFRGANPFEVAEHYPMGTAARGGGGGSHAGKGTAPSPSLSASSSPVKVGPKPSATSAGGSLRRLRHLLPFHGRSRRTDDSGHGGGGRSGSSDSSGRSEASRNGHRGRSTPRGAFASANASSSDGSLDARGRHGAAATAKAPLPSQAPTPSSAPVGKGGGDSRRRFGLLSTAAQRLLRRGEGGRGAGERAEAAGAHGRFTVPPTHS